MRDRKGLPTKRNRSGLLVATVCALALVAGSMATTVQAAPGESWGGTLRVTEERSSETYNSDGQLVRTYSKAHSTLFNVTAVAGVDDDPYEQPLAGWEADYSEQENTPGRCGSYVTRVGEVTGTDGRLKITVLSETQLSIEVLEYGAPGTFPLTEYTGNCQGSQPPVQNGTATHLAFAVQTDASADAMELTGSSVQQFSDRTMTYQWDLARGANPTNGDDVMKGTPGNDVINLGGGNDIFDALGGDDKVHGARGDDRVHGDRGNDLVVGGSGGDRLFGDAGNDTIEGDGANAMSQAVNYRQGFVGGPDLLWGGGGRDRLTGGDGLDRFDGGPGNDICIVDSRREKNEAKGCEEIRLKRSR